MTQIHGIRFLPKTSVGRMQYAPTRTRKWYVRGDGVRFLPKTVMGRVQYAPTRGQKWYVRGGIYPIRFIIPPLRYEK